MDSSIFALCDATTNTGNGKAYILGTFHQIQSPAFPVIYPQFYSVLELTAWPEEYGRNFVAEIRITMEGRTTPINVFRQPMQVPHGGEVPFVNLNWIYQWNGMHFPEPGHYVFTVYIDDEQIAVTDLQLMLVPVMSGI